MTIYDISQEVFGCEVYPGDPIPEREVITDMENGDFYNLSAFHMCAHNGTHVDAPFHFWNKGKKIDEIALEKFIGMAYVSEHTGIVDAEDAIEILKKAEMLDKDSSKRILIKGKAEVSLDAAKVFAKARIFLIGNESQTVGPEQAPMAVHLVLLEAGVVLLEGIRLQDISEGVYFLNAAPLNLGGADGAPCRAILIK